MTSAEANIPTTRIRLLEDDGPSSTDPTALVTPVDPTDSESAPEIPEIELNLLGQPLGTPPPARVGDTLILEAKLVDPTPEPTIEVVDPAEVAAPAIETIDENISADIIEDLLLSEPNQRDNTIVESPLVFEPDYFVDDSMETTPAPLQLEPEEEEAPPKPKRWGAILAAMLLLTLLGLLALAMRTPTAAVAASPLARHAILSVDTPGAIVAGSDGQILGTSPLRIAGGARVVIAADGYEPVDLTLPAMGRISLSLEPAQTDAASCAIDVPSGIHVEGLGAELATGEDALEISGATLVRVRYAGATLAQILRCGDAAHIEVPRATKAKLSVLGQSKVVLDGATVGRAPLTSDVGAGFHKVALGENDVWVPVFGQTVISI